MLQVSVFCDGDDDEAYVYDVPLSTPWGDIQTMVQLIHPTATYISIEVVVEY